VNCDFANSEIIFRKCNEGKTMTRKRIDWETLEPTLRKLKKEELLQVLHDIYQLRPPLGWYRFSAST
jgi:hypothetical protein